MNIEEAVVERLRKLSLERQKEVLDFVEFLQAKSAQDTPRDMEKSALELAGDLIGSVDDGPGDLATNPGHLEGYGRD